MIKRKFIPCVVLLAIAAAFVIQIPAARSAGQVTVTFLPIFNTPGGTTAATVYYNEPYAEAKPISLTDGVPYDVSFQANSDNSLFIPSGTIITNIGTYGLLTDTWDFNVGSDSLFIPVFISADTNDGTRCFALLADANITVSLDLLTEHSGALTVNGESGSSSVSGNLLTLSEGDLAVIRGLSPGYSYTLNGFDYTSAKQGTFVRQSTSYGGGNGGGNQNNSGIDKEMLSFALSEAKQFENMSDSYSENSWDTFLEALLNAKAMYVNANAAQGEVDSAAKDLLDAIGGLEFTVSLRTGETFDPTDSAELALYLPEEFTGTVNGSTITLEIWAADYEYVAALRFSFSYDSDLLTYEYAEGVNGYTALESTVSGDAVTVVLSQLNSTKVVPNSFSRKVIDKSDAGFLIAKLRFRSKNAGEDAKVTLTSATAAAIDKDGYGADVKTTLSSDTVKFNVRNGASQLEPTLDLNGDNILSLADLTTAQNWYRESNANTEVWVKAQYADYDNDGVITVKDLLTLLVTLRDKNIPF
ncbi:MAG: hypothetical protein LBN43_01155 [Oscillospiraceae bacterium]|jgi:hypothetical protein|nr:hypothetical protein [Oscillospiraceae bacterium]